MSKTPKRRADGFGPAQDRTGSPPRGQAVAMVGTALDPAKPLSKPASNRAERAAERRAAIVQAALDEFIARGFAATRLDDVAKRAGVAKGTIYLHFEDKESLFQELIRAKMSPVVGTLEAAF